MAMKVRRTWAGLLVIGSLLGGVVGGAGCELQNGTKVAQGQLYLSGEARFDAYFRDVHALQVAVAHWSDDKKLARRPLIGVLALTPDAADVTIVQATHEKMIAFSRDGGGTKLDVTPDDARVMVLPGTKGDATFFRGLEETVRTEIDRDRKLQQLVPKIDELAKAGRALEPHVGETFTTRGPGKTTEVRGELSASLDTLQTFTQRARQSSRESEDFITDLQRGALISTDPGPARRDAKPPTAVAAKAPAKPAGAMSSKPAAPATAKKPDETPAAAPPPKPAAKPAETGEVFNP